MGDRIDEWRHFFTTFIEAAEMEGEDSLRVQLKDDPEALVAACDLARREVTCCAFFDFSIVIESTRNWLVVAVPPEAREILAGLAGQLPGGKPDPVGSPAGP
jgi:hypothetical protein